MRYTYFLLLNLCGAVLSDYLSGSHMMRGESFDNNDREAIGHVEIGPSTDSYDGIPLDTPSDNDSLIAMQFSKNPHLGKDKMELVLSGKFMLFDVMMVENDDNIVGSFCDFEFNQTKKNPSLSPRYADFYAESTHCQEHPVSLPLHEVAEACRKHDNDRLSSRKSGGRRMSAIDPDAFILHQPKSGSTLLSNMLTVARPGEIRVISEPAALSDILKCRNCDHQLKIQALQDTMYLLGRSTKDQSSSSEGQQLFVKMSSRHTNGLPVLRDAFPSTKWLYIYRDANTVLQKLMNSKYDRRLCSTHRFHPETQLMDYLALKGESIESVESVEEACAAHLASQMATVMNELTKDDGSATTNGRLVAYNELLSRESIGQLFDYLEVSPSDWDRVEEQRYKRSNNGLGEEWKGESELYVSEEVDGATSRFNFDRE